MSDESWQSRGRERRRGKGSQGRRLEPHVNNFRQADARSSSSNTGLVKRMDLIASVSRSSGLEKDGDDLKIHKIQEEYRKFIRDKANDVLSMQGHRESESEDERRQRIDKQQNLLILFRKLREGVQSSSRNDEFALEVYETSLYFSVICESPKQTTPLIHHLFPAKSGAGTDPSHLTMPSPSIYSVLITLLHYLTVFYPSQSTFHQHLDCIPDGLLPRKSALSTWLHAITQSMRTGNYARFSSLSQETLIIDLVNNHLQTNLDGFRSDGRSSLDSNAPHTKALLSLVQQLRRRVSDTSWNVIRSAYREISCNNHSPETTNWLKRMLSLEPFHFENKEPVIEAWLEEKASLGHVRRKDGVGGRWIICKVR